MLMGCKQEGYRGLALILGCCVGILSIMDKIRTFQRHRVLMGCKQEGYRGLALIC